MRSATSAWRHARCGAKRTVRRSEAMKPATARPTAFTACLSATSSTAATIASSRARSPAGVGAREVSSTEPRASTTPARTLVPPMSTPTVSISRSS